MSLTLFDQRGCSLRTCLLSALGELTGFSGTWNNSATPAGRWWWVLSTSEPRTDGTGSGSSGAWTTPQSHDAQGTPDASRHGRYGTKHGGRNLPDHIASVQGWPSPSAQDAERGAESKATKEARGAGVVNLREACNWPTPRAEDSEQTGGPGEAMDTLTSAGRQWVTPQTVDAKVKPQPMRLKQDRQSRDPNTPGSYRGDLADQAWATPAAQDGKNDTLPPSQIDRDPVVGQCLRVHGSTNGKPRGSLNPAWVCQLQGFPDGWLDSDWLDLPNHTT